MFHDGRPTYRKITNTTQLIGKKQWILTFYANFLIVGIPSCRMLIDVYLLTGIFHSVKTRQKRKQSLMLQKV